MKTPETTIKQDATLSQGWPRDAAVQTVFHTPAAGCVTTDVTVTTYDWSQVRLLRCVISVFLQAIHIRIYLIFLETIRSLPTFCTDNIYVYLHWSFYGGLRKTILFLREGRFGRSGSSKVIHVGANRKRICDFLLVCLGPILHPCNLITLLCVGSRGNFTIESILSSSIMYSPAAHRYLGATCYTVPAAVFY